MKRGTLIGISAGAAALVAIGGIVWIAANGPPPPEEGAEPYLAALSTGDYSQVEALLADDVEIDDETKAAFSNAVSYIEDYTFEVVPDASGAIGVKADVTLGGEPGVVFFGLWQQGGEWRVNADFLGTVQAETTRGDSAVVGGVVVPASDPLAVFPAVYLVTAAPSYLLSGSTEVAVTNESPTEVQITAELTDAASVRALEVLDEYAVACTVAATSVPENCGFRIPWAAQLATLDSVAFRIEEHPVVTLDAAASTFTATGGVVVATVTGTPRDGADASITYRIDNWILRGLYRFAGDEMLLDVG